MLGRPGLGRPGKFWDPHTICEDRCLASQGPAHRFGDMPSFRSHNEPADADHRAPPPGRDGDPDGTCPPDQARISSAWGPQQAERTGLGWACSLGRLGPSGWGPLAGPRGKNSRDMGAAAPSKNKLMVLFVPRKSRKLCLK